MKAIHKLYVDEVYRELRPYHANWTPDQPVRLGDIGKLDGRRFLPLTALKNVGIGFQIRQNHGPAHHQFSSAGDVEIRSIGVGTKLSQSGKINLSFKRAGSVFFNFAGCSYTAVAEKRGLGEKMLEFFHRGKWDLDWVVLTEVVIARSATVVIASSAGATLGLEASSRVGAFDLADASVDFKATSARGVGYQIVAAQGLVPVFGLSRLRRRWLAEPEFSAEGRAFAGGESEGEEFVFEDIA